MRIGPRCDTACANACIITGHVLPWVTELRHLGVFIVRSRNFKCSLDTAKRSFYRAANAIFGKVGRIASDDVTLLLISSECTPLLLYCLESFTLSSPQLASLDFTTNRFFMKLFRKPITSKLLKYASLNLVLNFLLLCWHVEKKNFCVKLISVIIICYACSVRLLRLVTPRCVCIVHCVFMFELYN